jgi:hypothetical protein
VVAQELGDCTIPLKTLVPDQPKVCPRHVLRIGGVLLSSRVVLVDRLQDLWLPMDNQNTTGELHLILQWCPFMGGVDQDAVDQLSQSVPDPAAVAAEAAASAAAGGDIKDFAPPAAGMKAMPMEEKAGAGAGSGPDSSDQPQQQQQPAATPERKKSMPAHAHLSRDISRSSIVQVGEAAGAGAVSPLVRAPSSAPGASTPTGAASAGAGAGLPPTHQRAVSRTMTFAAGALLVTVHSASELKAMVIE